jgi:hypothetical protein
MVPPDDAFPHRTNEEDRSVAASARALCHSLAKLPEPETTHDLFWRIIFFDESKSLPCGCDLGG